MIIFEYEILFLDKCDERGNSTFKVNDYVVYKSMGVYKITDITVDRDINNNEPEFYVLQQASKDNLTIKIPVNNQKVLMRAVITKDNVLSLIASIAKTETVWIDNNKERSESFKEALKSGVPVPLA